MALNFATNITARQYYSIHGNFGQPDDDYDHEPAASRPTSGVPDISGLSSVEQSTITLWAAQVDRNPINIVAPSLNADGTALSSDVQTAIATYQTYFQTVAYKAWNMANRMARRAQWKWLNADAHDLAAASVAPSSVASGTGSSPALNNIPPSTS